MKGILIKTNSNLYIWTKDILEGNEQWCAQENAFIPNLSHVCQKVRHSIKYSDWKCHRLAWVLVNYKWFPDLENQSCGELLLGAFSSPNSLFILLTNHRSDVDWVLAPTHTHTTEEHHLSFLFPTVWSQHWSSDNMQTLLVLPGHPYF